MLNFSEITAHSRLYNFHSHTQFCDGRATMEEFAQAAVAAGFSDYGFSPHSPIPIESPCNMSKDNVEEYLAEVNRFKQLYRGKTHFYTSMEIDYLNDNWGPAHSYFSSIPLDYKIGSVHFIPTRHGEFIDVDGKFENFKKKMSAFFDNDIRYVVETFYKQTLSMIYAGGFDIIGHFDKIARNANDFHPGIEDEAWYQQLVAQVIEAIRNKKFRIEINTKSYEEIGRFFPNVRYWPMLKKYEIPFVVNSDAHYPDRINSGRMEAFALLSNL